MARSNNIHGLLDFVRSKLKQGKKPSQVKKLLRRKGLNTEEATALIQDVQYEEVIDSAPVRAEIRKAGQSNMIFGALWFFGGILVTILTFSMARGSGGGTYVIAWGAVVFGAIQFVRGFLQAQESR